MHPQCAKESSDRGGTIFLLKNKRVLVTGGAGFLGRNVCAAIELRGAAELIIPRKARYDLTEQSMVRKLLDDSCPDVIVHLAAAVGGIGANRANPGRYFYENALMGILLLEEARKRGVAKFVNVSTVCAYPKFTPVPFHEDDLWSGYPEETNAAFGIAKKAVMVQGQSYREQYGTAVISLVPTNLYGPGDNFDSGSSHVIPALIKRAVEAREEGHTYIDVWGTGSATRDFLFVRDAAEGIVVATEMYDEIDPVNLGSGIEITIRAVAEMVCELVGFTGELRWDATKPDGQPRRCVDVARAAERFGFRATTDFRVGLQEAISWFESSRSQLLAARRSH